MEELLKRYPSLDGVQFDYIRYPDVHPFYGYTHANLDRFYKKTGLTSFDETYEQWKNWKRAQVTEFLEFLVKRTRKIRPGIRISTTGCIPYVRAYHEAFQDWPQWLDRALVDFVTVMDYSADPVEFQRFLVDAKGKTKHPERMNVAVGAYKKETTAHSCASQWGICETSSCGKCVAFYYGNFSKNAALAVALTETS